MKIHMSDLSDALYGSSATGGGQEKSIPTSDSSFSDALHPENLSHRMAFDRAWTQNGRLLQNHFQWSEKQTADQLVNQRIAFAGMFDPADMRDCHGAYTRRATSPQLTNADIDEATKKGEAERVRLNEELRAEYTWAYDRINQKAQEMIQGKKDFKKLMDDAGAGNDGVIARALFKRAKYLLRKEGKI
jgi:hypothetical protein